MLFAQYVEKQEPHVSGVCYTRIHMLKHPIPTGAVNFKGLCLHKDSNLARLPYDRWGLINKTTSYKNIDNTKLPVCVYARVGARTRV